MSEENNGQEAGGEQGKEFQPITSQEEFERALGKRLERERSKFADYDELRAKAERFDKAEEANKSELQKIQERAEAAEKRAQTLEQENLKAAVAADKGLSLKQAKRLVGSTREELEKDADEILADFAPTTTTKRTEPKRLKSGSSSESQDGRGRAAAAVRALRNQ